MPNWCVGELKVRGKYKDIKNFCINELRNIVYGEEVPLKIETGYEYFKIESNSHIEDLYLLGTDRCYFRSPIEVEELMEDEEIRIEILHLTCANSLFSCKDVLIKDSKKYNLDFKIYAYEGGAGYNYDFEVWSGKVVTDKIIQFSNYIWECTNPSLGG